ncbi:MAG: carboxypeptidase regulatory-like domain-containing protein, partial [Flavisolibacter sp.]|nr:carboxypeptidase regulatory-like domain-containing protein [Flavisolibacter sp.]
MNCNQLKLKGYLLALPFCLFLLHAFNGTAQEVETKGANQAEGASAVRGLVQSSTNEPLAGVSVTVRNTKNNFTSGTTTDNAGMFTFPKLPSGGPYSFTFSAVGYEEQTLSGYNIKENISLSLAVKLMASTKTMEQVVVVGYGTQKRKDLTGSVASVGSKDIKELAVTRVDQALSGKVAGVQVKAVSGEPGAPPQINIRGIGSISAGTGPLYVVDGFPTSNIETLNPND